MSPLYVCFAMIVWISGVSLTLSLAASPTKPFLPFNARSYHKALRMGGGFRDSYNFMPPIIKEKLEKGLLTPRELDKQFKLSQSDIESILKISSTGFAGVVYSLDTALADLKQLFGYSYALLAGEIDQPTPHPRKVYDTMGSSFKTTVTAFGWNLDLQNLDNYESRYFGIMDKLIEKLPIQAVPGAATSVSNLLLERNQLSVVTSLPRPLAIKVMRKTQLGMLFEGRVPPDNLVCRPDLTSAAASVESYSGQQIIQCCGYMRCPTVLSVYVDGNARNMLRAKRDGLGVIGLQGINNFTIYNFLFLTGIASLIHVEFSALFIEN